MNIKAVAAGAAFLSTIACSGAAFAQGAPAQSMQAPMRGQHMSNHNLRTEHRRLLRIIDSLQRDQHDYGGHRVRAIQLLQQARVELEQGLQYERDHPGI